MTTPEQAFEEFFRAEVQNHGISSIRRRSYLKRVFLAAYEIGWLAAVKAHDASGCPQIFIMEGSVLTQ